MPPYVIFHDTTLLAMARQRPRAHAELAEIPGVGRSKLERYGRAMLAIIRGEDAPLGAELIWLDCSSETCAKFGAAC